MDELVADILDALRAHHTLDAKQLDRIIRAHSKLIHDGRRFFAKKRILPYYLSQRNACTQSWKSWNVDADLDMRFVSTLRMKPRRTASGVATITVITKPWPCSSSCAYCPNDVRMPKSYLHDEPACQRAERNFFDPYLQVSARLSTLELMGHAVDKVELIVLGGTWSDYPTSYQNWFMTGLFNALNDDNRQRCQKSKMLRSYYTQHSIPSDPEALSALCAHEQQLVLEGSSTYNEAIARLYGSDSPWWCLNADQHATIDELLIEHKRNERATHRCVGLVVETRPDLINPDSLRALRQFGCTKIQMGVQSIDDSVLNANGRKSCASDTVRAFSLARLFGFKIHSHFMVNLLSTTPEKDIADYDIFANSPNYTPDEVKLYPCALVAGTRLVSSFEDGVWRPYTEDELVDVLSHAVLCTPEWMRVSRMIRDISAGDILVGNKKTNLRQMVDNYLMHQSDSVREIRFREIAGESVEIDSLVMRETVYETRSTTEHFLEWVTPEGKITGFLRLSFPNDDIEESLLPNGKGHAMIREVHVYGFAQRIDKPGEQAQHQGLGKALISKACEIATNNAYCAIDVISAIGTREYYRKLGFTDSGLYLSKPL